MVLVLVNIHPLPPNTGRIVIKQTEVADTWEKTEYHKTFGNFVFIRH